MTIITINLAGGSMNEKRTPNIEAMTSTANLDAMKMNTALRIVIATGIGTGTQSAIGIGNPETEKETGIGTGIETEARKEETGTEKGKGNEGTGIEGKETRKGNEETETKETEIETKSYLVNHKSHCMKPHLLRRHRLVILLDPSSKKCLPLTLIALVPCLHLQRQALMSDVRLLAHYFRIYLPSLKSLPPVLAFPSKYGLFCIIDLDCSTCFFVIQ
ncbi:hypothetical protein BYT27DRAFT_6375214 [Phlegmacium glaucopus]|nr:hypothetical protein BYT27DRAFT_6375214 [Phlegmacium glaucopus]